MTKPELIKGAHILLIDDVFTTGATIAACAQELKHAGAKQVDALIVAKRIKSGGEGGIRTLAGA